jgi:hypothetical protein
VVDGLAVVVAVLDDRVLEAVVGFLAAAVVAAVVLVLGLLGELAALPTASEVRRAAPVVETDARFFSSSETDGRGRCDTVEVAVEVDGRFEAAVVPAAGRVGGLFKPAAAALVRVVELVVELVADFAAAGTVAPGRRAAEVAVAAVPVRFGAAVPAVAFLSTTALGEVGDIVGAGSGAGSGADSGADSGAGSVAGSGAAGASVCWTTSNSASDMMGYEEDVVGQLGD